MKSNWKLPIKLHIFESLWLLLSLLILTSVLSLSFGVFNPLTSIIVTSLLFFSLIILNVVTISFKDQRFDWVILVILLLSLLLRLGPWLYLEGGQDQGTYISMSSQFERNGGITYPDNVYSLLTTELKEKYVQLEGWKALGFNRIGETSEITSNFYPAHPLIMSIFGFLFGDENRVLSLTVFSILSIAATFLLTKEITKNRKIGYIAAILISLSPLHLYFSKFPVTEIMTLALNLSSLYFIYRAYYKKETYLLWLSLLLINVTLYTRLTWIISLPIFVIIILMVLTYEKEKFVKKEWGLWGIAILISFLISTLFYFLNINFLYYYFYAKIFKFIPEIWFYIILFALPFILFLLSTRFNEYTKKVFSYLFKYRNWIMWGIFIFLLYSTVKHFYLMVFTDKFVGGWFDYFWGMARGGWIILKDMPLSSIIFYITPIGLIVWVLSIKTLNTPAKFLLFLYMMIYTAFNFYITRYTPHHFYYARYQLSEMIPIIIIFISIYSWEFIKTKKIITYLILIPILIYSGFHSAFLYQGPVGTTPDMFKQLSTNVENKDILLFYNPLDWADNFVFAPLKYYYDFKAINVNQLTDVYDYGTKIKNYYVDDVYILSTVPIDNSKLFLVDKLKFEKGFYANIREDNPPLYNEINDWQIPNCKKYIPEKFCSGPIPIKYHKASLDLYLYNYR